VKHSVKSYAISDDKIHREMQQPCYQKKPLHPLKAYELADILQLSGKEIVIRFLNSLCLSVQEDNTSLIAKLHEELRRAVLLKNSRCQYLPETYTEYVVKNLFELLGHGVYWTQKRFTKGLKEILSQFLSKPTPKGCKVVLSLLAEYWNVPSASGFIVDVVTCLAVKDFVNQKNQLSADQARRSIEEYFITSEASIVNDIMMRIESQIGEFHG